MAKFQIDPAMITTLTDAGFVDGSGNITIRFPHRPSGNNADTFYELTFHATNDIIEVTNDRCERSIEAHRMPIEVSGGTTYLGRSSHAKMFLSVPEEDTNPTLDPGVDGVDGISIYDRILVNNYKKKSGDPACPANDERDKTVMTAWVTTAANYFNS